MNKDPSMYLSIYSIAARKDFGRRGSSVSCVGRTGKLFVLPIFLAGLLRLERAVQELTNEMIEWYKSASPIWLFHFDTHTHTHTHTHTPTHTHYAQHEPHQPISAQGEKIIRDFQSDSSIYEFCH